MSESPGERVEPDPAEMAQRIREAARDARGVLDDLDDTPWPQMDLMWYMQATWGMDVVLRELLEAIEAANPEPHSVTSEQTRAVTANQLLVNRFRDLDVVDEAARQRTETWLVWSAIHDIKRRIKLDRLVELTVFDFVPGLREAVAEFPGDVTDLDRLDFLRSPNEALGGTTPARWLLVGGDVRCVLALIRDLRDH